MATERQITANRANTKRSTGPKTAAGKMKSCGNSYRHGLSCSLPLSSAEAMTANVIAQTLTSEGVKLSYAEEFAQAQSELVRIRRVRGEIWQRRILASATRKNYVDW